ncbi:MAG TPA: serine hydrolase [Pyrinomonadaceae bacterium]|nr:serine hydrolase [Pyrinomonadaceae bacterium]
MRKTILLCVSILIFSVVGLCQNKVELLDKYVESARNQWQVPGLAITVVQNGKVVFSKGYGVRELGKNEPVTTETLFGAMSTTKAMTVVGLAMLVDEGKVNWDDKVIKYLPNFRIGDPYITNELRVRDLLTHNAGLGNADFLWDWTPELSSDEILNRMQFATPAYSLRSSFIYQNIMYLVAGKVIEKVSGMPWEKFISQRLFAPLGMKNTFPNLALSQKYQNRSVAHFDIKGKIQVITESSADQIAAAGAVWSTANDIAKWVEFLLENKDASGKPLLKPETLNELFKPQTMVTPSQFYPTAAITKPHWMTYGLGFFQHDYRGEMVNFHTGSLAGRTAIIGLLRDKNLGVYIFGNLDHAEVRHALMYKVFDLFAFNDNSRDWSSEFKTLYDGIKEQGKKQEAEIKAKRVLNTKPSLPLSTYTGKYSSPFYGTVEIALVDGKLKAIFSKNVSAELGHWQFDTFMGAWNKSWDGESLFTFQLSPVSAEVVSVSVDGAVLNKEPKK